MAHGRATGGGDDDFLGLVSLFAGLDAPMRGAVAASAESVSVAAGQWLFREGEPDDGLYVVRSGRVEIVAESSDPPTVLRVLAPGDALGELAVLTEGVRSASARAVRDAELIRIGRDRFAALIERDPRFASALLHMLATKVRQSVPTQAHQRPARVFSVVSTSPRARVEPIVRSLAAALSRHGRTETIGLDDVLGEPKAWSAVVDRAEEAHDWVVLWAEAATGQDGWPSFCARQADRVVLVTDTALPPPAEISQWRRNVDIAVVGPRRGPVAPGWTGAGAVRALHHIDRDSAAGIGRMARRLTRRSVGIVLSGGGARGLAHVGVLAALSEAGVAVDRVGGVSIGALIGGLHATGMAAAGVADVCRRELVSKRPFTDYTVPRVSLIRARRATQMVERLFETARFEELERPLFCLTADLVSGAQVVHRWGPVAPAIAASMRLPGIAPPVRDGDRILVDGGVLNNLPVDVMAADAEGPIIAVDVMRSPPGRAGDDGLPSIFETLSRTTVLASWARGQANRALADLVVTPDVSRIGLLEWRRMDAAVDAGRRATEIALASGHWSP